MKRKSRLDSQKAWMDLALWYCSKRETSRSGLLRYLKRKLRETREDHTPQTEEAEGWLVTVVDECVRLRIVEDARYADILQREFERRGKGSRYIRQKLMEKGLKERVETLVIDPERELLRAVDLASRTLERSAFKNIADPRELRMKLLRKLVSSGFDLGTAKRAVEEAIRGLS
jgi:SOS response regulatory protein OraA/RecX